MRPKSLLFGCATAALALTAGMAKCQSPTTTPHYTLTDLGTVDQMAADLVPAFNSHGDATVWVQNADQSFCPALAKGDDIRAAAGSETATVQTAPLPVPTGYKNAFTYSLNDKGDAVGWANTTLNPVDSISTMHAVLFTGGKAVDIGTLGGKNSRAYAINDGGLITGISDTADKSQMGFLYSREKMTSLPPLPTGTSTVAFGLNNAGVVAGASQVKLPDMKFPIVHAVIWRSGKPQDLGSIEKTDFTVAYGVNDNDDVVGVEEKRDGSDVVLYSNGKLTDLNIDGRAFDIDDKRRIVGSQELPDPQPPVGFLWDNGKFYNLNDCLPTGHKFRIQAAYKINAGGQIACLASDLGHMHVVILTPNDK